MSEKKSNPPISRRKALGAVASLSALAALPIGVSGKNPGAIINTEAPALPGIARLNHPGRSRQFTTFNPQNKEKAYPIQPGEKRDLVHYQGAGIISRLWMTFSGWFWMYWEPETYTDPKILKKLVLRIYWDGQPFPSVEAPIGDFFGMGQCEYKPYLSKFLGLSSGGFYSYFPMPFSKGVRIEVENFHDKVVPYVFINANYQELEHLPEDAGRFHCLYHSGANPGAAPLTVLKATGKGQYVGCSISLQGKENNYLSFLEAPEYFYIDTKDRTVPTIVGTGMEDYFSGGWYFRNGAFNGMYHGVSLKDALRSMITMYRFHEEDLICFDENLELIFLNPRPAEQLKEFKFSSTAYWYQDKAAPPAFPLPPKNQLVDWYRIRDTDHQSIP